MSLGEVEKNPCFLLATINNDKRDGGNNNRGAVVAIVPLCARERGEGKKGRLYCLGLQWKGGDYCFGKAREIFPRVSEKSVRGFFAAIVLWKFNCCVVLFGEKLNK